MKKLCSLLLLILWIWVPTLSAQETTVEVPDLTGLNTAQAAARLNEVGLKLGKEEVVLWTAASPLMPNTISEQSVAPGTAVPAASHVDVGVLRSPNMSLIYDDNDITVINRAGSIVDVTGMRFASKEGGAASLSVPDRLNTFLRENQCFQVWTVWRNGPKAVEGCNFIQSWLRGAEVSEHFWTQTSGVQQFVVLENGVERITCPAAPAGSENSPLTCEFFYGGAGSADITPYIVFAYTPDAIAIINQSEDKWMPTDRTTILNPNAEGAELFMGDPALYGNPEAVGDIRLLAPGQCILLTINHPEGMEPPQDCHVIAHADINPQFAFWTANFEIKSATDGQRHSCPAATAERPVLCILPQ